MISTLSENEILEYILWFLYFVGLFLIFFWVSIVLSSDYLEKRRKKPKILPENKLPNLTLLIPMWNEQETIERTLDHVFKLDYKKEKLKVICINDGSTDNTLKILKRLKKKYDFDILDQKNQGKYVALNNGIKKVKTDYFLCLDADSYPKENSLKILVSEMMETDNATMSPVMEVYKPKTLIQKLQWVEYLMSVFLKYLSSHVDGMMVVSGPFSIYNTKYAKEIGGFKSGHLTEDFEIALRFQKNGYRLGQSRFAKVYTSSPKTLGALVRQRVRWNLGNFLCMKDYFRSFFFNKRFQDFGLFIFPTMFLSSFLLLFAFSVVIYMTVKSILSRIHNFSLVNFDFMTYIKNPSFDITLYSFDLRVMFLLFFSIGLLSWMFIVASRETGIELTWKKFLRNFLPFCFFVFLFRFLILVVWLIVIKRLIFRNKLKWLK